MKILKHNTKKMSKGQIVRAHAEAVVNIAQAKRYEHEDQTVDISKLIHAAMNDCPCADELIERTDCETDDTKAWECPHCGCHHYMRKE